MLVNAKAPLDTLNADHATPLTVAAWQNCGEIVSFLIQMKAKIDCRQENGATPLILAAREHIPQSPYSRRRHNPRCSLGRAPRVRPLPSQKRHRCLSSRDRRGFGAHLAARAQSALLKQALAITRVLDVLVRMQRVGEIGWHRDRELVGERQLGRLS